MLNAFVNLYIVLQANLLGCNFRTVVTCHNYWQV